MHDTRRRRRSEVGNSGAGYGQRAKEGMEEQDWGLDGQTYTEVPDLLRDHVIKQPVRGAELLQKV